MGYQESYIRMKDSKDFEKLVNAIKEGNIRGNFFWATPVRIITLLKPIKGDLGAMCRSDEYSFDKGEKFIYVVGERGQQRNANVFLGQGDSEPSEEILKDVEIYFTECFPSDDIFENNDKLKMAIHEPFPWSSENIIGLKCIRDVMTEDSASGEEVGKSFTKDKVYEVISKKEEKGYEVISDLYKFCTLDIDSKFFNDSFEVVRE